jgi:hypothetical protein
VGVLMDEAQGVPPMDGERKAQGPWGNLSSGQLASLHGGLNGLEWCDALTGQADRHPGNYHVRLDLDGQTVKVTGIDNDRAFGSKQNRIFQTGEVAGFQSVGMPTLIDKSVYDSIMVPGFRKKALQGLPELLSEEEVKATEKRIDAVIDAVRRLDQRFTVTNWATWKSPPPDSKTATAYLLEQKSGSLFARDFAQFFPRTEAERQDKQKITQSEAELAALQSVER